MRPEQWAQVVREGAECPVLAICADRVTYGHQSQEDALVAAAIELSRVRRELLAERQRTMRMMQALPGVPAALLG